MSSFLSTSQSIAMADMDPGQLEAFLTAQMKRQGGGGMSEGQASALSRFWRSQRARVRESLLAQSRWEPGLRGLAWRVDLQTSSGRGPEAAPGGPVALLELELGRPSQVKPPVVHCHLSLGNIMHSYFIFPPYFTNLQFYNEEMKKYPYYCI